MSDFFSSILGVIFGAFISSGISQKGGVGFSNVSQTDSVKSSEGSAILSTIWGTSVKV